MEKRKPWKFRVAADTSLGVVFTTLVAQGTGAALVTETIKARIAEAHNLPIEEVYEIIGPLQGVD